MSKRICFNTYEDWKGVFEKLDADSCKELIMAVFSYGLTKEVPKMSFVADLAFTSIKPLMDRDWEKFEKIVERNKSNSKNAGRKPKETKTTKDIPNNPVDFLDFQENSVDNLEIQTPQIINNKIINKEINNNIINKPKGYESLDFSFVEEPFMECFFRWLNYKKNKGQKYKDRDSLTTLYKRLKQLSSDDPINAEKIIEQSIANNWAGLFKLKEEYGNNKGNERIAHSEGARALQGCLEDWQESDGV